MSNVSTKAKPGKITISMRMSRHVKNAVDMVAFDQGITKSEVIETAIVRSLKLNKKRRPQTEPLLRVAM